MVLLILFIFQIKKKKKERSTADLNICKKSINDENQLLELFYVPGWELTRGKCTLAKRLTLKRENDYF